MLRYSCFVLTFCAAVVACDSDSSDRESGGSAGSSAGAGGEAIGGEASAGGSESNGGGEPGQSGMPAVGGEGGEGGAINAAGESGSDGGAGGAPPNAVCEPGDICFALDGARLSAPGGGYRLMHMTLGQFTFVKYEMGADQLSIEIYGLETGSYEVTDVQTAGGARVTWYSGYGEQQVVYRAKSGTVTLTQYTDDFYVDGTFDAALEQVIDDQYTGEEHSVSAGSFSNVFLPAID